MRIVSATSVTIYATTTSLQLGFGRTISPLGVRRPTSIDPEPLHNPSWASVVAKRDSYMALILHFPTARIRSRRCPADRRTVMKKPGFEEQLHAEIREFTGKLRELRQEMMRERLHRSRSDRADENPPRRSGSKKR